MLEHVLCPNSHDSNMDDSVFEDSNYGTKVLEMLSVASSASSELKVSFRYLTGIHAHGHDVIAYCRNRRFLLIGSGMFQV